MKKVLLSVMVLAALAAAAVAVYTVGNVEPVAGQYKTFYHDTLIVKVGTSRTLTFPKQSWNFKVWINDPYTREESLKVAVSFSPIVGNPGAEPTGFGITDFGYANEEDTIYFYGGLGTVTFTPSTSTAGADANDSLACIEYWASAL